jgi:hypothetical protein
MVTLGFRPAELDAMDAAEIASWRAVMAAYAAAAERSR